MKSFLNLASKIPCQVFRTSVSRRQTLHTSKSYPQKVISRASLTQGCTQFTSGRRSIRCFAMSQSQEFKGQSVADLETWLQSYGIDTALYGSGSAKPLELLLEEVEEGETVLSAASGTAQRAVSVVNVRVRNSKDQVLYEAFQLLPTGSKRPRDLPLSEKMFPGENWKDAAARGIREELGPILPTDPQIDIEVDTYKRTDEKKESQSYPGLQTNVRFSRGARRPHSKKLDLFFVYLLQLQVAFPLLIHPSLLFPSTAVYMPSRRCSCSRVTRGWIHNI